WRKGRAILKPGEKYEMKQEGRLTKLIINNVEESDAGKYSLEWRRGTELLRNGDKYQMRKKDLLNGICTLVIKNLTANDSGVYTCEVLNKFGVTSYNGNITVVQPQKLVHPPLATFEMYVARADCSPDSGNKDSFVLKGGQFVEVLDSVHPDRWLVRTKPTKTNPARQGWVCPAYLEKKRKVGYKQ
uniref:Ig-like domain-containing protein n=1 Tax=Labrus bergylta TaxID=56723 RepID=A0A3Q3EDQ8_9LABR